MTEATSESPSSVGEPPAEPTGGRLHEAGAMLRQRAHDARVAAGEQISHARDNARERLAAIGDATGQTAKAAGDALRDNPLTALVGGLAAGLVAGLVIPRGEREKATLAPLGAKIGTTARQAAAAAKDAGRSQLDELGLKPDAAREQASKLFQGLGKAAGAAATAAAGKVRDRED